jgi:hypothetical protein
MQEEDNAKVGAIATQWSASTQAEIVVHRKALEQEKDPVRKNELYAKIAALELINAERSTAIEQGKENVEVHNEKQAYLNLAANPKAIQRKGGLLNYDQFYTNAIKLAQERGDESQVATLNANWETSRNAHIAIAQAALENTGSEEERDQLYKLIAALEAMNSEKKPLATNATPTTGVSETAVAGAGEATQTSLDEPLSIFNEQGEVRDYDVAYKAWIEETQKTEDPYQKTTQLVKIHQNWASSIGTEVRHKEQLQSETKKKKEKEAIGNDIAQLKVQQQEQVKKAQEYKEQLASMPSPQESKKEEQLAMYKHEKLAVKYDLIDYHYEGAEADMQKVGELIMEVIGIESEIANKQSMLDASGDNEERQRLMNEIKALEKRSGELQLAVSAIFAKADEKEFAFQRQRLENAPKTGTPQEEQLVDSIAVLAQAQYNEAQTRRKVAAGASSFSEQKSLLQQAFELERMAFQTQRKAFEIREDELMLGKEVDEGKEDGVNQLAGAGSTNVPTGEAAAETEVEPAENQETSAIETPVEEEAIALRTTPEVKSTEEELNTDVQAEEGELLQLTKSEVEEIESNEQYVAYSNAQEEISRLAKEAEVTYSKAEALEQEAKVLSEAAGQRREEAKGIRKKKQRNLVIAEADRMESEAQLLKARSDSTRLVAEQLDNDAEAKRSDSREELKSVDDDALFQRLLAYYEAKLNGLLKVREEQRLFTSSEGDEPPVSVSPGAEVAPEVFENIDFTQLPEVIEQDVFVKAKAKTVSAYSASKPIPIDEVSLPEGVVFKVQIGAFRNPIPQDLFKGFAPVNGERTASGITRYTAGIFTRFRSADQAKQEIRNLGYNDAFVVAFRNGKRIPISEALALLGEGGDETQGGQVAEANSPQGNRQETAQSTNRNVAANGGGTANGEILAEAQDVQQIRGLFYTVQVGVYSNTKVPEQLAGIRPLNSERTAQGYIRYTSGVYTTFEEAVARRRALVNQGVSDAFITAYSDGKRISVGEARKLNK